MSQNTYQKNNNNSADGEGADNDKSDMFTSIEQGFEKIHSGVQKLTPAYTQSISNLQQEYLTAWKNLVCSTISVQRQYAGKAGLNTGSVDVAAQIIQKMAEEAARSFEIQGTMVRAFLDSSEQNLKRFNESTTRYTEWQQKFMSLENNSNK